MRGLLLLFAMVAGSSCACSSGPSSPAHPIAAAKGDSQSSPSEWTERFSSTSLDWTTPLGHGDELGAVYEVRSSPAGGFLHARHDRSPQQPRHVAAIHYGKAFEHDAPSLDKISGLHWKWRVLRHPAIVDDAWVDVAASVYVIVKTPSLLWGGKGFKFGWVAKPAAEGTHQRGLLQIALRSEAASDQWNEEHVDLCALFRAHFGPCEGEHVLYVGVVTDADGTGSIAEADYGDFALTMRR